MMQRTTPLGLCLIALTALTSQATDVFYMDSKSVSENGRYQIDAKSPDNQGGNGEKPFARNFTYTLSDLETSKTVWTRQQGEREGSCGQLYVDNDGWVVIRTGWNSVIVVSPAGQDTGTVNILTESLSPREREDYVRYSTAGPIWSGYSTWYFVRQSRQRLFIVRPWWDRRTIIDIEKGTLVPETPKITDACNAYEKQWVLSVLGKAAQTREQWERDHRDAQPGPILRAAYLAGKMRIKEALPFLVEIQDSSYRGISASAWSEYKPPEGGVNRSSWRELTMRRVVHLSLRRLGASPAPYACTEFDRHIKSDPVKGSPAKQSAVIDLLPHERAQHAREIKKGMTPGKVLAMIGAPDFNDSDKWQYDIDADTPYSLTVTWIENGVSEIARERPPLWKSESRDHEIMY